MTQSTAHAHPPSSHHHRRTASNAPKVKSSRPALHRRSTTHHSILKLGSGQPKQPVVAHDGCKSEMAASFLNFCAMCERQITVPDNSLLYCSESCRRKDSCKPLPASCPTTSMSLPATPPASPPLSPRSIVAPMTPTRVSSSAAIRVPGENHETNTDLDPTEWKPVIPMGSGPGGLNTLATSDAWQFLSQFHDEPMLPMCRPSAGNRNSTTSLSALSAHGALPALTHTPSTVASSFSSNASDGAGSIHEAVAHNRPLPPRHSSTSVTKGVELVVPHVKAPAEDATAADLSDHGSIFPASSSLLWDDSSEKTPTNA